MSTETYGLYFLGVMTGDSIQVDIYGKLELCLFQSWFFTVLSTIQFNSIRRLASIDQFSTTVVS